MKKLALVALALCSYVTSCSPIDTNNPNVWVRTAEPRLSGSSRWHECQPERRSGGRLVEALSCGSVALSEKPCPDAALVNTRDDALRVLVTQPRCTDTAIAALARIAPGDLTAAYLIRARRHDRPSDFLRAADAAGKSPATAVNLFNRALAYEAIGLTSDAIASWKAFLKLDDSAWAAEARGRLARLESAPDPTEQWILIAERLKRAVYRKDRQSAADAVWRYPAAARRFLEEELLPDDLAGARLLADELQRSTGDRFAIDTVNALARARTERATLIEGHRSFRRARLLTRAFKTDKARDEYQAAAKLLGRGGSPLHLLARLRSGGDPVAIEREATSRGYRHLAAYALATHGYLLTVDHLYVQALAAYDAALAAYEAIRDGAGIASVYTRRSGLYRLVGHTERAWDDAFQAFRHAPSQVEAQERHLLLGETAANALAFEFPEVALLYQNAAIAQIRKHTPGIAPEQLERIRQLQQNLAIAFRERAAIYLQLGDYRRAEADLDEALRLSNQPGVSDDDENLRALRTRLYAVRGRALMQRDPNGAVRSFDNSLANSGGEFPTVIAAIFLQRAEANRLAGLPAEADRDVALALEEILKEETLQLGGRAKGEGEAIWGPFFRRFEDYHRLRIRQLTDARQHEEAFLHLERSRAFELLDLVRQVGIAPPEFRTLTSGSQRITLQQIQDALPAGTYLLAYSVLDDRTYTWIISRSGFEVAQQNVRRSDVMRWTASLQEAVQKRMLPVFESALAPPYDGLIALPLSIVRKMMRADPAPGPLRLVFIPDGAMNGLPFAALRGPDTDFLIREAPLAIASSASLYLYALSRDRALHIAKPSALFVGNPAFDSSSPLVSGLGGLTYAGAEARALERMYAPDAKSLVGGEATVPAFFEHARTKTIVHIAAHALANPDEPPRSLLLFAPSPGHSGALDAEELLIRLQLGQTKLFVLSACSSARGLPVGPQGVAPLVRPLIAAGVPAIVGTLWDVDDATAKELMVSFHRHYREGLDVTVALQKAQLDLLENKNRGLKSVLAWAPFQVIGHAESPFGPAHQK